MKREPQSVDELIEKERHAAQQLDLGDLRGKALRDLCARELDEGITVDGDELEQHGRAPSSTPRTVRTQRARREREMREVVVAIGNCRIGKAMCESRAKRRKSQRMRRVLARLG